MIQSGSIVRLANGESPRMVVDTTKDGRAECAWLDKEEKEHRLSIAVASLYECKPLFVQVISNGVHRRRFWFEPMPDGSYTRLYEDSPDAELPQQWGDGRQDLTGVMFPPNEPFPEVSIMPKPFSH